MPERADPDAHFGGYAPEYARFRPTYPEALFERLSRIAGRDARVLDCCAGSGQATRGLLRAFGRVVASDVSPRQLSEAPPLPGLHRVAAAAEDTPFVAGAFDLVTVAQALHWLDFERFFTEVRRIVRPGGAFAVWTYDLARVSDDVDVGIDRLYADILGDSWLPERRFVEAAYGTIPVPFEAIEAVELRMETRWTLDELLGYLRTWSAARIYAERRGEDPVGLVGRELARAWGRPSARRRRVTWPVTLRAFRVR